MVPTINVSVVIVIVDFVMMREELRVESCVLAFSSLGLPVQEEAAGFVRRLSQHYSKMKQEKCRINGQNNNIISLSFGCTSATFLLLGHVVRSIDYVLLRSESYVVQL